MTYVFKLPLKAASAWYPLLASACVAQVLDEMKVTNHVKFANDVFINDKKACGILCKSELHRCFKIEIGIGVNLNAPKEAYQDVPTASSLFSETGTTVDVIEFFWKLT